MMRVFCVCVCVCVLFIPCCGTSFQSPSAKVGFLIGAECSLTATRIKEAEKKMVLSCLWSVYTLKMWQNELKHQKEWEAFFVHSWFTLTPCFFSLSCINYQLSKAYSQFLYYLPLSFFFFFGSLTFIVCEWRYDSVQQWALCVFSADNVCKRRPAAEMGGNTDWTYFVWVPWRGDVGRDKRVQRVPGFFHIT